MIGFLYIMQFRRSDWLKIILQSDAPKFQPEPQATTNRGHRPRECRQRPGQEFTEDRVYVLYVQYKYCTSKPEKTNMSNYMSLYMYSKLKLWDAVYAYFYNRNLRFFYVELSPVTEFIDPVFAKTSLCREGYFLLPYNE